MFDRLDLFTEPLSEKPADLKRFPDWSFGNLRRDTPNDGALAGNDKPYAMPVGETATLARAWLDVNCSMCHLPDGIAPMKRDLRFNVPPEKMNLIDEPIGQRRRRPEHVRLIAPGKPLDSDLLSRVGMRGPYQMPPLATHYIDPHAYEILRRWIVEMNSKK